MKTRIFNIVLIAVLLLAGKQLGWSQGFVNLDFEAAKIPSPPIYADITASNVFPGWTVSAPYIAYDSFAISGGSITIFDSNSSWSPIQGKYSVFFASANIPGYGFPISIGQIGQVPLMAKTITFWGDIGGMQITFNGLPLAFSPIGGGASYIIYGADISAYAGETGQLLFTVPPYIPGGEGGYLDNIQFSSTPVPEPSTFALAALGALLLGCRRQRN